MPGAPRSRPRCSRRSCCRAAAVPQYKFYGMIYLHAINVYRYQDVIARPSGRGHPQKQAFSVDECLPGGGRHISWRGWLPLRMLRSHRSWGASHQPAGHALPGRGPLHQPAGHVLSGGTCPTRRRPLHQPAGHVFPGGDAFADAGRGDVDHGGGDDFYPETPGQSLFKAMESIWNAFACIKDIGRRT